LPCCYWSEINYVPCSVMNLIHVSMITGTSSLVSGWHDNRFSTFYNKPRR